jgi:hypothetical protein
MKHLYPQIALAEAQLVTARGDYSRALEACDRALARAQQLEMRPAMLAAHIGAARALAALGRDADAATRRASAQNIVAVIAALIDDAAMRAQYQSNHQIGLS